ncbi:uncharacterized protein LOC133840066 [Drosophila sulfurigaster albostrigata]|uniref:uncharacterized protein LOC133840066 n=1 Tax=Drosophila sulfurigaster albostrigata TaxID=89887 RepID=UPI002D21EB7C|nr:uncharacterized protein LOC133840066 [Drosophila sulfurigaster albostrigata]
MSTEVVLLLLLGLLLRGGESLPGGADNRKFIAKLNDSNVADPLIDECTLMPTGGNQLNLKSVIHAVVNDDWERIQFVLQMANEACTLELSHAIYKTLWLEWQQDKQIYDPFKILDFYEQLNNESNVSTALLENVYQTFVARSAQLISAPFHTDSQSAEFPQVTRLLSHLRQSPQSYVRDILETLFDSVLTLESPLSVAQRLGNFNASITQLTMANLQLLNRIEVEFNSSAYITVLENLSQLMIQPIFNYEVDNSMRIEVYNLFNTSISLLYRSKKVCFSKANNENVYLFECLSGYFMCIHDQDYARAVFTVQLKLGDANNETQFAFQSPFWSNRYLAIDSTIKVQTEATRNVDGRGSSYWWHAALVKGGVAIYDAATSSSVLCAGDPSQWAGTNRYAYTRRAVDFDAHREECTWNIEDCSNK